MLNFIGRLSIPVRSARGGSLLVGAMLCPIDIFHACETLHSTFDVGVSSGMSRDDRPSANSASVVQIAFAVGRLPIAALPESHPNPRDGSRPRHEKQES